MMCKPCRKQNHSGCPSIAALDPNKPGMALSPESERVQLEGLCTCQHRDPKTKFDIGTEFVAQVDAA